MFREDRNHISVRVEDDGGQGRICALPGHDQDGFARNTLVDHVRQFQRLGLLDQELDGLVIGWCGLDSLNTDIFTK